MKNILVPLGVVVGLVAMALFGIATQALVLVIGSCGMWTPAMIAIGFWFAHRGISARAIFAPMVAILGVMVAFVIGLATNILPLTMVACGGVFPALIYTGWSLARAGDDGEIPTKAMPQTTSTILTEDEIKRMEKRKLAHQQKLVTSNGNGEFK